MFDVVDLSSQLLYLLFEREFEVGFGLRGRPDHFQLLFEITHQPLISPPTLLLLLNLLTTPQLPALQPPLDPFDLLDHGPYTLLMLAQSSVVIIRTLVEALAEALGKHLEVILQR
jgi:hypothetical protein